MGTKRNAITAEVGASIRLIRNSKGITAKDLAERLNLAESTVTAYERGERKIPIEHLVTITSILGVKLEDLYRQEELTGDKNYVAIS